MWLNIEQLSASLLWLPIGPWLCQLWPERRQEGETEGKEGWTLPSDSTLHNEDSFV